MNREEIFEKVKQIVVEAMGEEKEINMETSIVEDLGLDSLDIIEMIMTIEEEFEISIEDSAAETFVKVSDLIEYIEKAK